MLRFLLLISSSLQKKDTIFSLLVVHTAQLVQMSCYVFTAEQPAMD